MKVFTLEELPELMYMISKREKEKPDEGNFATMMFVGKPAKDDPLYMRMQKKVSNRWER
jgi:hypothetical protein